MLSQDFLDALFDIQDLPVGCQPEFPLDYFEEPAVVSDDLVAWMTEGCNPNMAPRADNG